MSRLAVANTVGGAANRRTTLYVVAFVVVAGGAVAVRVASGADATDGPPTAPPRPAHVMPNGALHAAPQHAQHARHATAAPAPYRVPTSPPPAAASPVSTPAPAAPDTVVVERESFGYTGDGRRDPFRSLMVTAALRPLPSELRLVAVAYDAAGIGSVAILRDGTTKAQYRVGVGGRIGRMRVLQIRPRTVIFAVEELGFSRTEVVTLSDSSVTKQP